MPADTTGVAAHSQTPLHIEAGPVSAQLVNGVFGDALVEVRLRGMRGRMLLDLGDSMRLSRRVLHKVSHVFITHAHFDHICGLLNLLRARLTRACPPCTVYGPPGIQQYVAAMVQGIQWDRIGADGPEFHVAEVSAAQLRWWRIKPGYDLTGSGTEPIDGDVIAARPELMVRAATLDHGIPVLAFALELANEYRVRLCRLAEDADASDL